MLAQEQIAADRLESNGDGHRDAHTPKDAHTLQGTHRQVADIQRARMLAAMVEEVAERGVANVTVSDVVARSGVSRRTFYEIFEDREDCFLAAFDNAIARIASVVIPAYEQKGNWQTKIRSAITVLLEYLDREPSTGRLVIVETLGAGQIALAHRKRSIAQIIAIVDHGRNESRTGAGAPPLTAEGAVGGALSVLHARLTEPDPGNLTELAGPLTSMIVLPYLGTTAARREIERPAPKPGPKRPPATRNPLQGLEMRLTYRTVRVLMAVAAHPGSSNRAVAGGAGIADQGQISKLLNRLHGLGLIDNASGTPTRGEPNAWTLTERGWQVHAAISAQTSAG